jgi:hypothetical protein
LSPSGAQGSPSVLQVPPPGVVWQVTLQVVEQHSEGEPHAVPVDLQAVALHVLPEQFCEQHSELEPHVAPVALQKGLAHFPPEQVPEQHCVPMEQLE